MDKSSRPGIRPELVAGLIDQAPSRVRKRLDKAPAVAETWTWKVTETAVSISAGEETVYLGIDAQSKIVSDAKQVSCSCLLSPKCFHVLACVSCLPIDSTMATAHAATSDTMPVDSEVLADAPNVDITDAMREAAQRGIDAIEMMLHSGARRCGVVVQSSLLRAAHQCRAEGLVNLSAAILSIVEGVVRLRAQSGNTDASQLQSDLARAIVFARQVALQPSTDLQTIGQARRSFAPVNLSRLVSLLAEPIVTRSGYAGVCVYLLADDDQIYQVSEVRPGEADLASQVYRGGFELGATTISALQLCRSSVDVQNMTASPDHRLGRGSKTRWAMRKQTASPTDEPLADQVEQVFSRPEASTDTDFVGFRCEVLGRQQDSVLVKAENVSRLLTLRIALDTDQVTFRENLELLARSPGLELFVSGRLRRNEAGSIDALMIRVDERVADSSDRPHLELPGSWQNVCQLGLDRLERHFFSQTDPEDDLRPRRPTENNRSETGPRTDLVAGLGRQQIALVLGGRGSIASPSSQGHRRMIRKLKRQMLPTAAELAEAVASVAGATESRYPISANKPGHPPLCDLLAATHQYQTAFRSDYHRQAWQDWLS